MGEFSVEKLPLMRNKDDTQRRTKRERNYRVTHRVCGRRVPDKHGYGSRTVRSGTRVHVLTERKSEGSPWGSLPLPNPRLPVLVFLLCKLHKAVSYYVYMSVFARLFIHTSVRSHIPADGSDRTTIRLFKGGCFNYKGRGGFYGVCFF